MSEALRITDRQSVGVGTPAPSARLSIVAAGAGEIGGAAASATLRTSSGTLGSTAGTEIPLASFGLHTKDATSLGVRALRVTNGNDWQTTAIGLGIDVNDSVRVNNSSIWLHANGNVGVGVSSPVSRLHAAGNAGVLSLEGHDHLYMQWYPKGTAAGRRAYIGFGGPNGNQFTIDNESPNELNNPSRIHIVANESLYLLGRGTTYVSKAWGGNGELVVEGQLHGTLGALNVAEGDTAAYIRAHDLVFGHSSRRGEPGRALVDGGDVLWLNFESDWPGGIRYDGQFKASSRTLKDHIVPLTAEVAHSIVAALEPVTFSYKSHRTKSVDLGFIAEDSPAEVTSSDRQAIDMDRVVAALTRVVKDHEQALTAFGGRIDCLEKRDI